MATLKSWATSLREAAFGFEPRQACGGRVGAPASSGSKASFWNGGKTVDVGNGNGNGRAVHHESHSLCELVKPPFEHNLGQDRSAPSNHFHWVSGLSGCPPDRQVR